MLKLESKVLNFIVEINKLYEEKLTKDVSDLEGDICQMVMAICSYYLGMRAH